ncbi:protein translocase subunit SecD [Marinobacter nanhaiticus D15-8W]|uniref:Protein translocase subunit SecD n=1 Tax=Marinobacter nanhaiticus D15-8W TaxID=626887 RepID=N6WYD1_9GAMM|nr:protein translocase subunit SecD [Marinobacter nanhaiticus]ENO13793.2 protein translocase subunit SecD [Marinobacter nanhaiticus D15-8W]
MLNKFPLWKNIVILVAVVIGFIYALPNLYPDDYAIQITGARSSTVVDETTLSRAVDALQAQDITVKDASLNPPDALIRVTSAEAQLKARPIVQEALGREYLVALNMAPTTPEWLRSIGAGPMKLGLDLRGGVHFLLEVDMESAVQKRLEVFASEMKRELREERIRYRGGDVGEGNTVELTFRDESSRDEAFDLIRGQYNQFLLDETEGEDGQPQLVLTLSEQEIAQIEDYALQQNLTTIRNRVNELGVAEPLVQRQGRDRIVVELPGVQDTAQAKRVLGATANLEFRLEARQDAPTSATEVYPFRDNRDRTARLEQEIIVTGENVANAQQAFDENGQPQVNITMDSTGGDMMTRATRDAIKRRMAVLFIEYRTETVEKRVDGEMQEVEERKVDRSIISLATIQSTLGSSFRITGLDSTAEAAELALLLRAGSLAAPMYFVQERTIGPSLGQKNIDAGVMSVTVGFALVLLYMLAYYRFFGLVANIALTINLMLLVACMSILSATLTLPGIAGIVLTVGMAVDANVLIFERIKEELRLGVPPQSAINAGFSRAFVSIFDANITTLLVAIILFAMGSGPVKGFAVTLCIGILTSMFTALLVSRAIINMIYGGRKVEKLAIGGGKLANG